MEIFFLVRIGVKILQLIIKPKNLAYLLKIRVNPTRLRIGMRGAYMEHAQAHVAAA